MAVTVLTASVNNAQNKRKAIGFYFPDINVSEVVSFKNNVTLQPVESGETITDHFYKEALTVEISGYTGDDAYLINQQAGAPNVETGRALLAYETLKQLQDTREPFDVVTGYDTYERMLITELNLPRSLEQGDSLFFSCSLVQVRFVDTEKKRVTRSQRTTGRTARKVAPKVKKGKVQVRPVTPSQNISFQQKSVLIGIKSQFNIAGNSSLMVLSGGS